MAHVHRAKEHKTVGFAGCVAGERCNPASHGGVMHIDRCRCGAEKRTNVTGYAGRTETSGWVSADRNEDDPTTTRIR